MADPLSDDEDLLFNFFGSVIQEKFDDPRVRDQTGMRVVDFLVEFDDAHNFIEIKDGENPGAANPDAIKNKLKDGTLIHVLASKYRESRFFFSFQRRSEKKIRYVVLLWLDAVDDAQRVRLTDQLNAKIPSQHHSFVSDSVDECVILDVERFQERFGEESVWRLSDFQN